MSSEDILTFLEEIDDLDGSDVNNKRVIRRRINNFENFDDLEFFKRYRMSKEVNLFILDQIEKELEFNSDRNNSVAPIIQLLIALRFYATGNHLHAIADAHGVSVPTVSRIIKKVSRAIVNLREKYITMPSSETEIEHCQKEFYDIASFPFVIGSVDATHIKIQSTGEEDGELFRNRLGYFSINLQTVSDANLKVRNVVARWPGSTHDSAIFINSRVCHDFELGSYGQACLLGDSGYPLKNYLLTPYQEPNTEAQIAYNNSHIKTRNTVDRQYAVLKQRFPALAVGLKINLHTAIDVIIACCILHNICIDSREDMPPDEYDTEFLKTQIDNGQIEDNYTSDTHIDEDRRDIITNNYFVI